MKKWVISKADDSVVNSLSQMCDLSPLALKVVAARGISDLDGLAAFFTDNELSDPFMLKDMDKAVETINKAVDGFELICIYGDYDCDGVTSTAILYSYLECMGANVTYYIPDREEGYGMTPESVRKLHEMGAKLIITVDNGIAAINEAKLIKELGMELVITDHHQPLSELPEAAAVVDPHREDCESPFKELAGVGVVLKLCAALDGGGYEAVMEQYGDIAAIGTVADVVTLTGENRSIVRVGTELLRNTENPGLCRLMELCSLAPDKIDSTAMAYMIAPRINAAGRFADASVAVEMLVNESVAHENAEKLCEINARRKQVEASIIKEIMRAINSDKSIASSKVIVVSGKGWHHGVVGIVAARITELFGKPCVLLSEDEDGYARGSARSIHGFSIFKCLCSCADLLERFGGHECAGGLTIKTENIKSFKERVKAFADTLGQMPHAQLVADKVLTREDLTVGQIASLSVLEPYGSGNKQPAFAVIGAKVQKVTALSGGKHSKLEIAYDSTVQTALCFGKSPEQLGIYQGDKADMLVNATINEYGSRKSISLRVIDIRPSGVNQSKAFAALDSFERFMRGEQTDSKLAKLMLPTREELTSVYKAIRTYRVVTLDMLMCRMFTASVNFAKTAVSVNAFSQCGLVSLDSSTGTVTLVENAQKADIEGCEIIKRLKELAGV